MPSKTKKSTTVDYTPNEKLHTSLSECDTDIAILLSKKIRNVKKKVRKISEVEKNQKNKVLNEEQQRSIEHKQLYIQMLNHFDQLAQVIVDSNNKNSTKQTASKRVDDSVNITTHTKKSNNKDDVNEDVDTSSTPTSTTTVNTASEGAEMMVALFHANESNVASSLRPKITQFCATLSSPTVPLAEIQLHATNFVNATDTIAVSGVTYKQLYENVSQYRKNETGNNASDDDRPNSTGSDAVTSTNTSNNVATPDSKDSTNATESEQEQPTNTTNASINKQNGEDNIDGKENNKENKKNRADRGRRGGRRGRGAKQNNSDRSNTNNNNNNNNNNKRNDNKEASQKTNSNRGRGRNRGRVNNNNNNNINLTTKNTNNK